MLGSCCSFSSRTYGTITSHLLRNVTASRLSSSPLPDCGRREHTEHPPFSLRRQSATRWLHHSPSGREKNAPPSLSTPPRASLLDSSSSHNSLESFHAHAARTGLSRSSTVYTGTTYEYLAQSTLRPYGFDLHRVGGRGDRGVDLVGIWEIPILSHTGEWKETRHNTKSRGYNYAGVEEFEGIETLQLKVLVQCKRLSGRHARIGPNLVRELDGAVRASRSAALVDMIFSQDKTVSTTTDEGDEGSSRRDEEPRQSNPGLGQAIGVLVGTRPATKGVVDSMSRSTRGLVWVMMEEATDHDTSSGAESQLIAQNDSLPPASPPNSTTALKGRIKQILWNHAARGAGLEGVDVVKRYAWDGAEEVVLMRGGRVWGGKPRNQ
ncbi:hypothetical protein AYO20_10508 [Fonsecaea nubica]|uniref:Required for respiratory growth protein 7, mitochondrial n=1 Tax=Fonsecaea nubica TaxID=856822 RepID=A0A178C627_9EURO|nr:hypothetical protein AYO20_10508 [Fonsecaea nubica]OAL25398.1 hypothetical protein AYO20_10508 [Fonsecaea nubica]